MGVQKLSKPTRVGLIAVSFLLLVLNYVPLHLQPLADSGHKWEEFDSSLVKKIHSINDLKKQVQQQATVQKISPNSFEFARLYSRTIKQRFYHGYSYYSFQENWIAALLGKVFSQDLSAIVKPDDIMKYPMAACSQQCIVLMECFKQEGISFRKVGFDHHFAIEGKINNKWYFFDPDLEPDFSKVPRVSYDSLRKIDALITMYQNRLDEAGIKYGLANQFYGVENKDPAPNASIFHSATKFLSRTLWLLPLFLLYFFKERKTSNEAKPAEYAYMTP